jgi:hypothetical protein
MASSFLFGSCGIGNFFIDPMGCEDAGAPANLGRVGGGDATGVVTFPTFCYQIQIMTTTDLTV